MDCWRAHIVDNKISISERLTGPERDACSRFLNSFVRNDMDQWLCRYDKGNVFIGPTTATDCLHQNYAARKHNMTLKEPYEPLVPLHVYVVNYGPVSPDPALCPRDPQELYALRYPVTSRQSHMLVYLARFYGLLFLDPHFVGDDFTWDGILASPSRLVELMEVHYCLDESKFIDYQDEVKKRERSLPVPQMSSLSNNKRLSSSSSQAVSMPPPPPQHSSPSSSMPPPPPPQPAQQAYQSIMPPPHPSPQHHHHHQQQQQQQQQQSGQFPTSMPPQPQHHYSPTMPHPPPFASATHTSVSAPTQKLSPSQKRRHYKEDAAAHSRAVRRKSNPEASPRHGSFAAASAYSPNSYSMAPPSSKALGKRPEQMQPHDNRPRPSRPATFGPAVSPVAWPAPPMAASPSATWEKQQPNRYNSSPYHRRV